MIAGMKVMIKRSRKMKMMIVRWTTLMTTLTDTHTK